MNVVLLVAPVVAATFVDTGMHAQNVSAIVSSADRIATGGLDGQVRVWSSSGDLIATWSVDGTFVTSLAFSPDGTRLAVGGETLAVLDAASGAALAWREHAGVTALAWTEGHLYAGFRRGRVEELDPVTLAAKAGLGGCEAWIHKLAALPDGRVAIPCSSPPSVRVAAPGLGDVEVRETTVSRPDWAAWSPDGAGVAVAGGAGNVVEVLSPPRSRRVVLAWPVVRPAWTGSDLVIGGRAEGVEGGRLIRVGATGGEVWSRRVTDQALVAVHALADGALAWGAATPSWGVVEADGTPRFRKTSPALDVTRQFVGLARDGATVLIDGAERHLSFDLRAGSLRVEATGRVGEAVLSPETLALLGKSVKTVLWSIQPDPGAIIVLANGAEVRRIQPKASHFGADVSSDGRFVVADELDGTLRWYSVVTGEELAAAWIGADGTSWAAWTPAGAHATSPRFAWPLRRWEAASGRAAQLVDVAGPSDLAAVWNAIVAAPAGSSPGPG